MNNKGKSIIGPWREEDPDDIRRHTEPVETPKNGPFYSIEKIVALVIISTFTIAGILAIVPSRQTVDIQVKVKEFLNIVIKTNSMPSDSSQKGELK